MHEFVFANVVVHKFVLLLFISLCCCSLVSFVVVHYFVLLLSMCLVLPMLLFISLFCCCSLVYVVVH